MSPSTPREKVAKYAQLREDFQNCRALMDRARARALRASEEAMALRMLLKARANKDGPAIDHDVWAAAARAIAEMTRERDRLLGTVSHELRQALSAAVAARRVMVEQRDDAVNAKAEAVLDRQLQHLTNLIDTLLDYSRLTLGTTLEAKPLDLRDIVREAVDAFESGAADKAITLSVETPVTPQIVIGDATRLRQVLSNLLHNAMRYTPRGGRIRCTTATVAGDAQIIVSDTGEGIDTNELERIFEPFTRAAVHGAGLGVGLALARRIVQLHGGSLTAQSDGPGLGSTFTAVVPLAQVAV